MPPGSDPVDRRPRSRRRRNLLFAAVVVFVFFLGANTLVEWLERRGVVETTGQPDAAGFVEEALFERDGGRWRTTPYAERSLVASSFAARKRGRYRIFALGGSFAMGSPWVHQNSDGGGGIPDYLRDALHDQSGVEIEVVNAAAGGADSHRVLEVAREVARHEADLWFVATCNNEGTPSPTALRAWLQRQGGYRLLRQLIAPTAAEPGWYTPQDPDTASVRDDFRRNLASILDLAEARSIPVLLATLPVNLGYRGFEPGHLLDDPDSRDRVRPTDPAVAADSIRHPPPPSTLARRPCKAGILAFEAADFEGAAPLLAACLERPSDPVLEAPWITSYLALAELEIGHRAPSARARLADRWGSCLADGILAVYDGRHDEASEVLAGCDDVAEALRWLGRVELESGDRAEAARLLEQAVELRPSNRCRPSFNGLIRQEAAGRSGVTLVDLEAAAKEVSDGLPGSDLFLDYCHMSCAGYARMGQEVLQAAGSAEPRLSVESTPSAQEFCRRHGVPGGPVLDQVTEALRRSGEPVGR